MAVLSTTALTIAEWAKRLDPTGKIPVIAELLSQTNDILKRFLFVKANGSTYHREVIRTGLPTVYWRAINQGVPTSASKTRAADEVLGQMEAYSKVDVGLLKLSEEPEATRMSEDVAFMEAMNQEAASSFFYANPADDPNKPLGLAGRYSSTSSSYANSANVIDAGGSTAQNNLSVWLIGFGQQTIFLTFPKGSVAGLEHEDLGKQLIQGSDGSVYTAMVTHYVWRFGIVVKDWRYAVRICNVDVTKLISQTSSSVGDPTYSGALIKLMARAINHIPNRAMASLCWVMNRTAIAGLELQGLDKSASALAVQPALTQFEQAFRGIPICLCDALLDTEDVVA